MDTTYDPKQMTPVKVPFLSEDYFKLAQSRPDAAAALAQGERVIVVVDGKAYEVVEASAVSPGITLPATPAPAPTLPAPTISAPRIDPGTGQPVPNLQGEPSTAVWIVLGVVVGALGLFGVIRLMRR